MEIFTKYFALIAAIRGIQNLTLHLIGLLKFNVVIGLLIIVGQLNIILACCDRIQIIHCAVNSYKKYFFILVNYFIKLTPAAYRHLQLVLPVGRDTWVPGHTVHLSL